MWYRLEGMIPVKVASVEELCNVSWGKDAWRVALTELSDCTVSTVFLGLDHQFDDGPPLLFETLVFGGPFDGEMSRYSTWEQAEVGHNKMVKRVSDGETERLSSEQ